MKSNIVKKILDQLPGNYNIKVDTKSLEPVDVLQIIKEFLIKDTNNEGTISFIVLSEIIRNRFGFKISEEELKYLIKQEYQYDEVDVESYYLDNLIRILDILKREKITLNEFTKSLKYSVFIMLFVLIVIYLSIFYSYKQN